MGPKRVLREEIKTWTQGEIQEYLRQHDITWTFNPPTASHMGGLWERSIRTIRRILLAVMPNKGRGIDFDGLTTVFCEVEAVVNSRSLTEMRLEIDKDLPLTPNHLLRINPQIALPSIVNHKKNFYAQNRFKIVQYAADEFCKRWLKKYPSTIMSRQKWKQERKNLCVGEAVLIVDANSARGYCPLGKVIELCPDGHGLVQIVKLKTKDGCLHRPISKL